MQGEPLRISASGGTVRINSATVTQADIMAANGVIHVVDTVLLPPSLPQTGGEDGFAPPILGGVALSSWAGSPCGCGVARSRRSPGA